MNDETTTTPAPWWKYGHVWLVIAGPAAVVVAGIVTAVIAVARPRQSGPSTSRG